MVLKVGNSAKLWEFVSGVTTQNSLRGVGAESKTLFCNKPMVSIQGLGFEVPMV